MVVKTKFKILPVFIHALIWIAFGNALLIPQPLFWGIEIPYQLWIKQGIILLLLIGAYYTNSQILVPRLLLNDRIRDFLLAIALLGGVIIIASSFLDPWLQIPKLMDNAFKRHSPIHQGGHRHGYDSFMLTITALILGISTSVTVVQKRQHDKEVRQSLEQERTITELSFLKAQINPHFFFNTLNNIYALTLINVESSRAAIHKLSRMMRYLLYETHNDSTSLIKELDFIKDYIELMKLRLTDKVSLAYSQPNGLTDMQIAPMLFLPFVENAFKHGISETEPSFIEVSFVQEDQGLKFKVRNTVFNTTKLAADGNSGIGLANTKRRLELLYRGMYTLNYGLTGNNAFEVNLFIRPK